MSKGSINTFVLVINYLDEAWTSRHAIVRLFELHETKKFHGFATQIFVEKHWIISSNDCFCER